MDLIQAFKIISGHDDVDHTGTLWLRIIPEHRLNPTRHTAGGLTLEMPASRLDTRRNFFSLRVVQSWNRLPIETRKATTAQQFKNRIREEVFCESPLYWLRNKPTVKWRQVKRNRCPPRVEKDYKGLRVVRVQVQNDIFKKIPIFTL